EEQLVLEVRVRLKQGGVAVHGTPAAWAALEDADHAARQLLGALTQRAGRRSVDAGDAHRVAEAVLEAEQRAIQHVAGGEPDRAAPVGVAALHARRRLARLVRDLEPPRALPQHRGLALVLLGERARAEG